MIVSSSFCNADSQFSGEEEIEVGKMMEHKRSPCSVEQSSLTSLASKRQKADLSAKERKEKLGERIVALQQLVSPFGKTDTASVLCDAMEYINFLHDQVKVLSAPYLQSNPSKMQELGPYSLRSRGLCLVPVSCTAGVARSNGADIWAPIKTTSPKSLDSCQDSERDLSTPFALLLYLSSSSSLFPPPFL